MELSIVQNPAALAQIGVAGEVVGSDEWRLAGANAVGASESKGLAINLSAVTFIDATGLGALIHIHNILKERAVSLILVDPSAPMERLLTLTGLDNLFSISRQPLGCGES